MNDNGLTTVDGRNVWFLSERGKGFTSYADLAMKTPQGWPVAAPGEGLIAARHVLKNKTALWEYLLDEMEKMYILQEEVGNLGTAGAVERQEASQRQISVCAALIRAIAILDYGVADENSIKLAEEQAVLRYKLSSEE